MSAQQLNFPIRASFTKRIVAPEQANTAPAILGVMLWLASTYFYRARIYPKSKDFLNLCFFSAGSFFASKGYAQFLFSN